MAKYIPDNPKQRNALFLAIGFLLLLYPFNRFYYAGQKAEVTAMQSHLTTLQDKNRQAQVLAARGGGDLEKNMALYDRQVKKLEQLIPAAEEVPALLDDVNQRAQQLGVNVTKYTPDPPEPGAFYTKESYELAVVGQYQPVGKFLTEIASLPRIVTPVELDLSKFDNADVYPDLVAPVLAKFRIETYVLPQNGSAPAPSKSGE
jgi:type IV pilus assembly protein PilO